MCATSMFSVLACVLMSKLFPCLIEQCKLSYQARFRELPFARPVGIEFHIPAMVAMDRTLWISFLPNWECVWVCPLGYSHILMGDDCP
ncbi:hypothetical protein M758_UG341300 [Ceratodon purpureus]|nr:hypothetical protein M758_UG341300 [Ceratodon purpureus]